MKSIIRASSRYAAIFVTLHPNSETILKVPAAQDVTGIVPLDTIHRIDVMILGTRGDSAIRLAEEYFRHFRMGAPPYGTYPVEPELLEFMCYLKRGLIREFLELLHNALDYGIGNGYPELTFNYAMKHPSHVLGRVVDQKTVDGFNKHKSRAAAEEIHSFAREMGFDPNPLRMTLELPIRSTRGLLAILSAKAFFCSLDELFYGLLLRLFRVNPVMR